MKFDSLDNLLKVILSGPQWQRQKRYLEIKKIWYQIINHKVAQHSRPVSLKNEVLFIATANAVWSQELSLQRLSLLKKINRRLEIPLKDLHFASMNWNEQNLSVHSEEELNPIHPSLINSTHHTSENSETAQEALEKWFQQIKIRSSGWQNCPRCDTLCPEGELQRWGVCAICFRDHQVD